MLVGCGATVFARGKHVSDKDAEITEKLFSAVGICEEIPEDLIDTVTALAGSGPAYVSKLFNYFHSEFITNNFQLKFYTKNNLLLENYYKSKWEIKSKKKNEKRK